MINLQYSVVEQKINKFIEKYGVGELINYLEKYDTIVNKSDYELWMSLKSFTAKEFNIPLAELDGAYYKNSEQRRVVVHIAETVIKMNRKAMSALLNVSLRTIRNYIHDTQWRIKPEHEKVHPDFVRHYRNVLNKFNEWLNSQKV